MRLRNFWKEAMHNNKNMFTPKTARIKELAIKYPEAVTQMLELLSGAVNVYIDFANVRPWSERLGWHLEPRRLKQFLQSFDNVRSIKFYQGELIGDLRSQKEIKHLKTFEGGRFLLRTKPVKIMRFSVDITSIDKQSPILLRKFIRASLLRKLDIESIEFLNAKLSEMNKNGVYELEDRKCNFDVELGADMRVDHLRDGIDTFVLWSGDSDFADPVKQLLTAGKKVLLFATARRVASELGILQGEGLFIFDIQKIRNFICWLPEIEA